MQTKMDRAPRWLHPRLSRRQFLQGAAGVGSAVLFARLTRLARALDVPPPPGFLSEGEMRVIDAFTARLVPSGDTTGAHEAGVADYIQGLLSAFPGVDVNGDGRTSAADITAVIQALGTNDPAADVDGNGTVDAADVAFLQHSIFGTVLAGPPAYADRPLFAGGPFSGRTPFPDPATGTPSTNFSPGSLAATLPPPSIQLRSSTRRLIPPTGRS